MAISRIGEPRKAEVPDIPIPESRGFYEESISELSAAVRRLATAAENNTRYVDEYTPVGNGANWSVTTLSLQPQFENYSERIKRVLVFGPISATFTLQLGDRIWNLALTANGYVEISCDILLDRTAPRTLTSATAGAWFLELTGEADVRTRPIAR